MKSLLISIISFVIIIFFVHGILNFPPELYRELKEYCNDSERIDCLEAGQHQWKYVGYYEDGVYVKNLDQTVDGKCWLFKCSHCYRTAVQDRKHVKGALATAFEKATGVEFPKMCDNPDVVMRDGMVYDKIYETIYTDPCDYSRDTIDCNDSASSVEIDPNQLFGITGFEPSPLIIFHPDGDEVTIDANDFDTMPLQKLRDIGCAVALLRNTYLPDEAVNAVVDRLVRVMEEPQ